MAYIHDCRNLHDHHGYYYYDYEIFHVCPYWHYHQPNHHRLHHHYYPVQHLQLYSFSFLKMFQMPPTTEKRTNKVIKSKKKKKVMFSIFYIPLVKSPKGRLQHVPNYCHIHLMHNKLLLRNAESFL